MPGFLIHQLQVFVVALGEQPRIEQAFVDLLGAFLDLLKTR
jgi:hypothetical protein